MDPVLRRRSALAYGIASLLLPGALTGCLPRRAITTPMESVFDQADAWQRADTLLVLLPGAFDQPADFIHEGFVKAVRGRRIAADIELLDAHTEYYMQQIIVERLLDEVVRPARAHGYRHIWLVGISLGGYGSLLFAKAHGALIDGVFAIAPYLGRRDLPAQIAAAGGLARWEPPADRSTPDAFDIDLWRWLQGYTSTPPDRPPLYLGYGTDDRFARSNAVLAAVLPHERVLTVDGAHTWAPWLRLWSAFLERAPLPHQSRISSPGSTGSAR